MKEVIAMCIITNLHICTTAGSLYFTNHQLLHLLGGSYTSIIWKLINCNNHLN